MIIVDVETTGPDTRRHSIVSIGGVDFSYPANHFYRECRPFDDAEIDPVALSVNGFTLEKLSAPDRPTLFEVIQEFLAWGRECHNQTLGGMNTFFDRDFLRHSTARHHLEWPFGSRIVDLHSICYAHIIQHGGQPPLKDQRTGLSNDRILNYVGLPDEPTPHHGLTGALMEAEAFSRLLHGRPLIQEFEAHPLPKWAGEPAGQRQLF
jgi:DNA polymerase III epsilon subunit-like protein